MSLWHGTLSLDTLTGCASPCKAAKSAEGFGSGVYVRWVSSGKRGERKMEFLNDAYRCQAGRPAARWGRVDYVIDTRLFGDAIPNPSPSRSHSFSFCSFLVPTTVTILPFLPQLSALSLPSVAA